jgi:UDP-N-acetylmuramyl pentapeptide phosphotransferase/UDP-N-acetylglucosamine-1-phosphate transferase
MGVVVGTLILLSGTTGDCGLDVECDGGGRVALVVLALAAATLGYMFYRYRRKRHRR